MTGGVQLLDSMTKLLSTMAEVTAGIDAYMLRCVANGVIEHQLGTAGTAGKGVKAVADDYAATRQEVLTEYEGLSRDFRRGNEVEWGKRVRAFERKLPDLGKRLKNVSTYFLGVQQAWTRLVEYANHPERLLPTYGLEASAVSARVDDRLNSLGDDCRLQETDAELRSGTERIKAGLAGAQAPMMGGAGRELSLGEASISYAYARGQWGPMSNTLKWSPPPPALAEGEALDLALSVAHPSEWKPTRYGFEAGSIAQPRGATGEKGDECYVQISGGAVCADGCGDYWAVITWPFKRQDVSR